MQKLVDMMNRIYDRQRGKVKKLKDKQAAAQAKHDAKTLALQAQINALEADQDYQAARAYLNMDAKRAAVAIAKAA